MEAESPHTLSLFLFQAGVPSLPIRPDNAITTGSQLYLKKKHEKQFLLTLQEIFLIHPIHYLLKHYPFLLAQLLSIFPTVLVKRAQVLQSKLCIIPEVIFQKILKHLRARVN